jgi:hypothetical protein
MTTSTRQRDSRSRRTTRENGNTRGNKKKKRDEGVTKANKRKKDDKGKPRPELAGYTQREDEERKRDENIRRGHCNREEEERPQLTDSEDEGHNDDQDGDTGDGFWSQVQEPTGGLEEGLKGKENMVGGSEYGAEKERGDDIMTKTKRMAVKAGMKEEWANDFWGFRQEGGNHHALPTMAEIAEFVELRKKTEDGENRCGEENGKEGTEVTVLTKSTITSSLTMDDGASIGKRVASAANLDKAIDLFKDENYYLAMIIKTKARKEVWRIKKIMATEKDVDSNSSFFDVFYKGAFCNCIKNVTLEKAKGMWETCGFKELGMKALRKRRADAVAAVKKEVISE